MTKFLSALIGAATSGGSRVPATISYGSVCRIAFPLDRPQRSSQPSVVIDSLRGVTLCPDVVHKPIVNSRLGAKLFADVGHYCNAHARTWPVIRRGKRYAINMRSHSCKVLTRRIVCSRSTSSQKFVAKKLSVKRFCVTINGGRQGADCFVGPQPNTRCGGTKT
jgi:hypothetical protein